MSRQAAASVPFCILPILQAVSTHTLSPDDLLKLSCFQWQPACFFRNRPYMPNSHPSSMFLLLFSHACLSASPPGFHVSVTVCLFPVPPLNRL